eukprot:m.38925 g.38925  ORF g.38925 m.38925 type:complete len:344 (+) comp11222_c1_seq1:125-1156(+)
MGNKPTSSSKVDTQRQPSAVTKPGSVTVQYDVMLSFAAKDLSLAAKIADQMRDGGLKVWYDDSKEFLKNGRAILESKAFVLLLTESSAESKHCKDDIALAFISNKPIVPVALQDLKKISEKMDFGLKLTLRPMKVLELDIKGSDADEQFQAVLGQIADESSTTDTQETGLMNKTTRIKLDKERQTAEDAFAGTGDFWQRHFATCDSVDWDEFCAVFSKDYQQDIAEVFGTGEEDREQLFKLLKQRLFHGKVVLDKSRYYEVCNRYGGEMVRQEWGGGVVVVVGEGYLSVSHLPFPHLGCDRLRFGKLCKLWPWRKIPSAKCLTCLVPCVSPLWRTLPTFRVPV